MHDDFWDDLNTRGTLATVEHLTVGPPGTGKTTWLTRQCQNAVAKYGTGAVAICSLTRAAAAEVGGRNTGIPPENIGTLHAHAYRGLDRPKLAETSTGAKAWNEVCGTSSWKISARSSDPDHMTEQQTWDAEGDRILADMNVLRARCIDPSLWPAHVQQFHSRWQQWKDEAGYLDFTDLIEHAIDHLDTMPSAPRIVMVDEAQDMSALEMKLARKWGHAADQLVIVGDPDQSLYTWRGADPEAVFGTDPEQIRVLSQSYRVPAAVHEVAVSMIERVPGRLPIDYHPRKTKAGDTVAGSVEEWAVQHNDPDPLVDLIEKMAAEGSVMVLTTCGYMLAPLVAKLKLRAIPFWNPYRTTQGAWNPLNGSSKLLAMMRPLGDVWDDQSRMWTWNDLRLIAEPMQARGNVRRGMKSYLDMKCQKDQFGSTQADEEVSILDVLKIFEEDAAERICSYDAEWWHSQLRHNDAKRQRYVVNVAKEHGARTLRQDPRVIVGTIHSVKGGQADTVILLPDLSTAGYWQGLKTTGETHDSVIRMFYVGMTRARERLILGRPSSPEHVDW